jgi:RNA polymerase sigma-70 factor, ECF subfamily
MPEPRSGIDLRDELEFERLCLQHRPAMLRAADAILRDPAAAEDVVQDVLLHVWRRPDGYDPARAPLRSYLVTMSRSRALDRWRARASNAAAVARAEREARVHAGVAESAADQVLRRYSAGRLLRALDELPDAQRQALLLAYGRGLSAPEVADVAGVPVGTAKSRVRLGLRRARLVLAD